MLRLCGRILRKCKSAVEAEADPKVTVRHFKNVARQFYRFSHCQFIASAQRNLFAQKQTLARGTGDVRTNLSSNTTVSNAPDVGAPIGICRPAVSSPDMSGHHDPRNAAHNVSDLKQGRGQNNIDSNHPELLTRRQTTRCDHPSYKKRRGHQYQHPETKPQDNSTDRADSKKSHHGFAPFRKERSPALPQRPRSQSVPSPLSPLDATITAGNLIQRKWQAQTDLISEKTNAE